MQDFIVPVAVAFLGLCGTIAGLLLGHRKWEKERRAEKAKGFEERRRDTYKELWERTEQLSVDGRIETISDDTFSVRISHINTYMMLNNLYIDDPDREVVNSYLRAARAFHEAVRVSGDLGSVRALGETLSMPPPSALSPTLKAIADTQAAALALRSGLLQKVRLVVSGEG